MLIRTKYAVNPFLSWHVFSVNNIQNLSIAVFFQGFQKFSDIQYQLTIINL